MALVANWHWPQYTLASVMLLQAIGCIWLHGKPRHNYDATMGISTMLFWALILGNGGFWN